MYIIVIVFLLFFIRKPVTEDTVWAYWNTIEKPEIVKRCIQNWKDVGGCKDVRVLNQYTIYRWIPLGVIIHFNSITNCEANKSDLIRLYILKHYGGIWMDCSVFVTRQLDWLPKGKVFCFRAERFDCFDTFFIKAPKASKFISEWLDQCIIEYSDENFLENNKQICENNNFGSNCDYLRAYIASTKIDSTGVVWESSEKGPFSHSMKAKWNPEEACKMISYDQKIIKLYSSERQKCSPDIVFSNKKTLVVARYKEDLKWLSEHPFSTIQDVVIYNKGDDNNFYKPKNSKIVKLPNIGRCDHTYLYHIINNYDTLSDNTIFLVGCVDLDMKKNRAIEVVNNSDKTYISCFKIDKTVTEDQGDFILDEWTSTHPKNRYKGEKLYPAAVRPFGTWFKQNIRDSSRHKCLAYGSMLAVSKTDIHSRDVSFYKNLIGQFRTSNDEVGHYIERSWLDIFI